MAKKYEINGKYFYFNFAQFNCYFKEAEGKKKIGMLEQELGDSLHVTKGTVHSWRYAVQSPNDLEIVKDINTIN